MDTFERRKKERRWHGEREKEMETYPNTEKSLPSINDDGMTHDSFESHSHCVCVTA